MRTKLFAVLLCLGVSAVTQAEPQYGVGDSQDRPKPYTSAPSEQEPDGPGARLREGLDRLLSFLSRSEAPSEEEIASFLDGEIAPYFDFDYMAQVAAGSMHRAMSDEQRERMAATIKQQFLGTLALRLSGYEDQGVHFLASRVNHDGRTGSASIALMNPRGYPARVDFRFYKNSDNWRVYDVLANGQSAVAHYRREFRRNMRRTEMARPAGTPYGMGHYR